MGFRPSLTFPLYADTTWEYDNDNMRVEWKTNIETSGKATLSRMKEGDGPSEYLPLDINTWGQFREHVGKLDYYRYLYRGAGKIVAGGCEPTSIESFGNKRSLSTWR